MFNLEGLIPKLCQLAQDVGDGENILCLRSAGLQALASMVQFLFVLSISNVTPIRKFLQIDAYMNL